MCRFQEFSVYNSTDRESSSLNIDYIFMQNFLSTTTGLNTDRCHDCLAHALRESSYELQIKVYAIVSGYFKKARVKAIYWLLV